MFTFTLILLIYIAIGFGVLWFTTIPGVAVVLGDTSEDALMTIFVWPILVIFMPFVFIDNIKESKDINNWLMNIVRKFQ